MVSQTSFAPHLAHFSRGSLALRLPGPHAVTIAGPSNVLEAPQLPHSIFTLAPNRTRSAGVSMCLWTLPPHRAVRTIREQTDSNYLTLFRDCFVFAANIKALERVLSDFGRRKGGGRRSTARQAAPLIAVISTVSETKRATLLDVSCAGARLRGADLPAPGDHFIFRVASVQAFATIAWSLNDECGATFETHLSDEEVELLRREAGSPSLAALSPEERLALEEWITGKAR